MGTEEFPSVSKLTQEQDMASERNPSMGKTGINDRIKQDGKQKIETTKRSAVDQIDQVAQALTRAGEELGQS